MWKFKYKESWAPKNWYFWPVVLEKTLESPLDCKEIQPVHPKGDQSWMFIWRSDVEAETPVLWPPYEKNWLIWKDPDAEGRRRRGDDRGWDGWMASPLNGLESEQAPGTGNGQGGLACCSPWGRKESDTTGLSDWTELHCFYLYVLRIWHAVTIT